MPAQSEPFGLYLVGSLVFNLALSRFPLYHLSDSCQVRSGSGSGAVCPLHDFVILSVAVFQAWRSPPLNRPNAQAKLHHCPGDALPLRCATAYVGQRPHLALRFDFWFVEEQMGQNGWQELPLGATDVEAKPYRVTCARLSCC